MQFHSPSRKSDPVPGRALATCIGTLLIGVSSNAWSATTFGTSASVVTGATALDFSNSAQVGVTRVTPNTGDALASGLLSDRVASGGDTTTLSFTQLLSTFGGLLDLKLVSNGTQGDGSNSESVVMTFLRGSTTVGSACAFGDFDPNVLGCHATRSTSYQTYLNFSAANASQYFDRVVFSYGDQANSGESYTFGAARFSAVTAVPEPETYALLLAGLGAIGFLSRRRKPD